MYRTIGDYRFEFMDNTVRINYRQTQSFSVNNYYLFNKRSINSFKKDVLKKREMDYDTLIRLTRQHKLNFMGTSARSDSGIKIIW